MFLKILFGFMVWWAIVITIQLGVALGMKSFYRGLSHENKSEE